MPIFSHGLALCFCLIMLPQWRSTETVSIPLCCTRHPCGTLKIVMADCIIKPRQYRFSRREIARHRCNDCSVNVIKIGDYCMVRSEIWDGELDLGWRDNLCIACIEKRLGRRLTPHDLGWGFSPSVDGYPKSDTLLERIQVETRRRKRRKALRS